MRNLRELMDAVLIQAGVDPAGGYAPFCIRSAAHEAFWEKLNGLYREKGVTIEGCNDVYTATQLDMAEYDELLQEAAALS